MICPVCRGEMQRDGNNFVCVVCGEELILKHNDAQPKWIPANTVSLPEEFEHVLVTDGKTVTTGTIYEAGGEKYWRVQNEPLLPIAVTHWMPLPEPPKEVKK